MHPWYPPCVLLLLLLPVAGIAQQGPVIRVEGRVYEQIEGRKIGISGVSLYISKHGREVTDAQGRFEVNLPAGNEPIHIEIHQTPYTILTPPGGILDLSGIFPARRPLNIDIIVQGEKPNADYEEKIRALNQKVRSLQARNRLTNRQAYTLQQTLLDTINHYEQQRYALEQRLLATEAQSAARGEEVGRLREQLAGLADENERLLGQLTQALEEKFLRQQKAFELATAGLKTYRSRTADLMDQLPGIAACFRDPQAFQQLSAAIDAYNEIYNQLESEHEGYLSEIRRYWKEKEPASKTEQAYRYALEEVHRQSVLPMQQEVIAHFRENPPKIRKAQQAADEAHARLQERMRILEEKMGHAIEALRAGL